MRIPRSLLALPVTMALGLTLAGTSAVADPPDPPGSKASLAGQEHRAERAQEALAAVEALLNGTTSRRGGTGGDADGRSLTLALRDLRTLKDALPEADRRTAERALARPGATARSCTKLICVHYTRTGPNRPNLRDRNGNRVPDYIDKVRTTVHGIHVKYKNAGYRSPKPDGRRGGDRRTDIYVRNIGGEGLYGYCTSDDPHNPFDPADPGYGNFSVWAYCVLDNNYSRTEFPTNTPIENVKVTAAHEYFHAVQYAYDAYEDGWILESTATWVEDEMFDAVNDNRYYLRRSPLAMPGVPLDTFGKKGFHYGTWIFWRYLTETYPESAAGLPTLVRDVWRRLDGRPGAPDEYSLQGLETVLAARGTGLTPQFANFADWNRHPSNQYEEGTSYRGFVAPPVVRNLTATFPGPNTANASLDHLTSKTVRYVPDASITSGWQLNLTVNLANDSKTRPAAVVTAFRQNGSTSSQRIPLDPTSGDGTVTVPFDFTNYKYVEVTLVNASNRFTKCWQQASPFTCSGIPTDDNLAASVTGIATPS